MKNLKLKLGNFDIKINFSRNEIRRRERVIRNAESHKHTREVINNRSDIAEGSSLSELM